MSKAHILTVAILAGSTFAGTVQAQGFRDFRNKNKIIAQKLEGEYKSTLKLVAEKQKTEAGEAVALLRELHDKLSRDRSLSALRRQELLLNVASHIRRIESQPDYRPKNSAPIRKTAGGNGGTTTSPANGGRTPSDVANDFIKGRRDSLLAADRAKREIEKRRTEWFNDLYARAAPPQGDFNLPANWRVKTELRKKLTGPKLTEREVSLLKTMNSVLSVDYQENSFKDVIADLQRRTGQTIFVDPNELRLADVEYSTPVTLQGKKISVRTALRAILKQVGLTYYLKDGIVQVVSHETASKTFTVRSYPIAGLMPPPRPGVPPAYYFAQQQAYANYIMATIVNTVEPGSWAANGGRGTIWYDPISRSILIRQNAELHIPASRALGGGYRR